MGVTRPLIDWTLKAKIYPKGSEHADSNFLSLSSYFSLWRQWLSLTVINSLSVCTQFWHVWKIFSLETTLCDFKQIEEVVSNQQVPSRALPVREMLPKICDVLSKAAFRNRIRAYVLSSSKNMRCRLAWTNLTTNASHLGLVQWFTKGLHRCHDHERRMRLMTIGSENPKSVSNSQRFYCRFKAF